MSILLREKLSEKIINVELDDSVQKAIDIANSKGVRKIALFDRNKNYWVIPLWKLSLLNPNISLKKAYDEKKEIFEKVDTVQGSEEIAKVISKLYEFSGLIMMEGEEIIGFVSLADFSDIELKQIKISEKPSLTIDQIKQKANTEGGLVGVDLSGANLSGADLRKTNLKGVNLSGADLGDANLWSADLTGANLSNANLIKANLKYANLSGTILYKTKLNEADMKHAQLWYADLEEAQLEKADLTDAVLFNANLKLANLRHANLKDAGLMNAKFYGADLSYANIIGANLKYALFDEKTKLNDIKKNYITIQNITDERVKKILNEIPDSYE